MTDDKIAEYKTRYSMDDTLKILDAVPLKRDLSPDHMLVEITNRAAIAHLAIERGLKYLLARACGTVKHKHSLGQFYKQLSELDKTTADQLADAFDDAVQFFGYNPNSNGFGHLRSLQTYLSLTGSDDAFQGLRYWAIGEPEHRAMQTLFLVLHRELLYFLTRLFWTAPETVSTRVERRISDALYNNRHISGGEGDTETETSVRLYQAWLRSHDSGRHVIRDIKRSAFDVGDEFANRIVREAYDGLSASEDDAVQYFLLTLEYLPKGSQPRPTDATPVVQFNANETQGFFTTPSGSDLGWLEKRHDNSWLVQPWIHSDSAPPAIVQSLADAKSYVVNSLTRMLRVHVNNEIRDSRIVTRFDFFISRFTRDWDNILVGKRPDYEFEFWDDEHGLVVGDEVKARMEPNTQSAIEGLVIEVKGCKVVVEGTEIPSSRVP